MLESAADTRGTVARVVDLMRALAEAGRDVGVSELAKRLGLPVSTVHRLLKLLIEQGMAEKARDRRRYRAGLELFRVGALVANQRHRAEEIEGVLRRVREECGEACLYCLYLPASHKVMAVSRVDGPIPLHYSYDLFQPMSLMWGATGRSILAFLPEAEVAELIGKPEPSPASGAPLPPASRLRAELAEVRDRGYAITQGQKINEAVGIAAPVFTDGCTPISSLCVIVPKYRFQWKMEPKIASILVREAAKLSEQSGCTSGPPGSRPRYGRRAA
jgi:DNA-binding IclR family transcriptional regulator